MNIINSLVVPVYNASDEIPHIKKDIDYLLNNSFNKLEIIFVCDGCDDNSESLLQEYFENKKEIRIISYENNQGKGYALRQGFNASRGNNVVFTDVDFSYSGKEIIKMFNELEAGEKLVLVNRRDPRSTFVIPPPLFRYIFIRHFYSNVFNKFVNLILKLNCPDTQSGLKGFDLNEYKKIEKKLSQNGFAFDIELILNFRKIGVQSKSLPIHWSYREEKSKVALFSDGIKMIIVVFKLFLKK